MKSNTARYIGFCIVLFIFFASLVLRTIRLTIDPVLMRDSALYLILAQEWIETGVFQNIEYNVAPLPIYTIKIIAPFVGDMEIAGRSIALFLGSMIPVIGYLISKKLFGDIRLSVICATVLILHPSLILYSIQPLRENNYLFFSGLVILEAINGFQRRSLVDWLLCGVFSSLAFYCRLEALENMIIIPLIIVCFCIMKKVHLKSGIIFISVFLFSVLFSFFVIPFITDFDYTFVSRIVFYIKEQI